MNIARLPDLLRKYYFKFSKNLRINVKHNSIITYRGPNFSITFRAFYIHRIAAVRLTGVVMARFYFHLSTPDEYFHDNIGYDVNDLAAAHSVAVRLAGRMETFVSFFLDRALDFRRWTVEVTDERHQRMITVMFPTKQRKKAEPETIPEPSA